MSSKKGNTAVKSESLNPFADVDYDINMGGGVMASELLKIRLPEKPVRMDIDESFDPASIYVSIPRNEKQFRSSVIMKTDKGFVRVIPIVKSSILGYINPSYQYRKDTTSEEHKKMGSPIVGYDFSPKSISDSLRLFIDRVKICMTKMLMFVSKRDMMPGNTGMAVSAAIEKGKKVAEISQTFVGSPISISKEGKEYINFKFVYFTDQKTRELKCITSLYGPPILEKGVKRPNIKQPHQFIVDGRSGYINIFDVEIDVNLTFGAAPTGMKNAFYKCGVRSAKYSIPERTSSSYNPDEDDRDPVVQEASPEECKISEELASLVSQKVLGDSPKEPKTIRKVKPPPPEEEEEEDEQPKKKVAKKKLVEEEEEEEEKPKKKVKKAVEDQEVGVPKKKILPVEEDSPKKKTSKVISEEEEEEEQPKKKTVKKSVKKSRFVEEDE